VPVPFRSDVMKRLLTIVPLFLLAVCAFADDVPAPQLSPKAEKFVSDVLPVCSAEMKSERVGFQHKLPSNLTGTVVRLTSERSTCSGQYITMVSREGDFFVGIPIFLDSAEGKNFEERVKDYGWKNGEQNFTGVVDRSKSHDGLFDAKLIQLTEAGKVTIDGSIDPDEKMFLFGKFIPMTTSYPEERLKALAPYASKAPSTGAAAPKVTVIEFSDFECPSCRNAAHYLKPIMDKYSDQVKYVRYDLPLVMAHPWAFSAALAGRAIYRQKPDVFWTYKEQIYSNQDKLTNFTIDEFARNFASDHELDMKKFDADVASAEVHEELLKGIGVAYANNVLATPTYVVNGRVVDPGGDGKALESYVAGLLKK
jgi:protein-disulfide isomerase